MEFRKTPLWEVSIRVKGRRLANQPNVVNDYFVQSEM